MSSSNVRNKKTSRETASAKSAESTDLLAAIDIAIDAMKKSLMEKGCEKGSLGDLIRLLHLRKELDAERPRCISVRWIDESEC